MFVKRARPRPATRTREVDADDASPAPTATDDNEVGGVMAKKKAQQKQKMAGKSRLSFGGDDEASTSAPFKQKKSLLSQALGAAAATPSRSVSPAPATYSRDYLEELKASTPSRAQASDTAELSTAAREKYGSVIAQDTSMGIMSPAAVAAAKARRAQAAGRGGDEYISLGDEPHPESRLMREEDEGEEGDEGLADYTGANDRLYLGKEGNRNAARRMRAEMEEMIEDREDESASDEEMREWEDTIVGRSGYAVTEAKVEKKTETKAAPFPAARPVPTLNSCEARLSQRQAQLRAGKIEAESALEVSTADLLLLENQERDLRKQVEEVEGKREWAEEFSGWAELLGSFLEEKSQTLDKIEEDSDQFMRERHEMVATRRMADDGDDLALFLGVPRPVEGVEKPLIDNTAPNSENRRKRRTARSDRREKRIGVVDAVATAAEEGFSTDSELEQDVEDDFTASQHDLERRVQALLEDVKAEDFRYPERGLAVRFADWRKRYPEDYEGAFADLALVQAWEFWARGEMVAWDPLRSDKRMENFTWFTALYEHSRPQDSDNFDEPSGEDLTAEMVNIAVVPLLIRVIGAGAYDPYSTPQTRRAVDLVDVVAELTGKTSKKCQSLIKALMGVFQVHIFSLSMAVASSGGPTSMPAPPYNPAARLAMRRFVRRRIKLIRNLRLWSRTASTEANDLIARIVSTVLRPVIARTWEGGGDEMAQKVIEAAGPQLPAELVSFLQSGPR